VTLPLTPSSHRRDVRSSSGPSASRRWAPLGRRCRLRLAHCAAPGDRSPSCETRTPTAPAGTVCAWGHRTHALEAKTFGLVQSSRLLRTFWALISPPTRATRKPRATIFSGLQTSQAYAPGLVGGVAVMIVVAAAFHSALIFPQRVDDTASVLPASRQ
jgi:hypothetical protein